MSEQVFRQVVGVGVLLACTASICQAFLLVALYKVGKEAGKAGKEVQAKVRPLVDHIGAFVVSSTQIMQENRFRVAALTAETLVTARHARQQIHSLSEVVDEAYGRFKRRMAQIDKSVDETVVQVERARNAVKSAVLHPVKKVSGLVAGVRAALTSFTQGGNRNPEISPKHSPSERNSFTSS